MSPLSRPGKAAGRLRAPLAAVSLFALGLACESEPSRAPPRTPPAPAAPPAPNTAPPPAPRPDGRLGNEGLTPLAYDLHLQVDPAAERFQGEAKLKVRVDRPSPFVVVHGRGLRAFQVEAVQGATRVRGAATARASAGTKGEPEELVLAFESQLPHGEVSIELRYDAAFPKGLRGLYRVREGGAAYAFTHFEPSDARTAFPCFDEPGVKVPVTLALDVPAGQRAFANMPELAQRPSPDGRWLTVAFAPSPPLPSYLVAFAVGPLDVAEGSASVPLRLVATKGKAQGAYALAAASGLLQKLEAYFGRPYAYPKLDLVAVPNFGAGAMENPGLITFREELLLFDEAKASTRARRRSAEVIAHELAHQWFGNLVTARWWDDLWLNEGFATFAVHKALDPWQPDFGATLDLVERKAAALEIDALPSARAVRQPVRSTGEALEAFDPITYAKGASVLRMLEHQVGPGPFQAGLRAYLNTHVHGSATSNEFLAALEQASTNGVGAVASSFLDRPGVPLVRARLECKGGPRVLLRQSAFATPPAPAGGAAVAPWRAPVCVAFGEPRQVRCTTLEGPEGAIELPGPACPAWFVPNADEAGYYRYALEPADLERLEKRRFAPLTDPERVGLLSNAAALVLAGELGADRALALARSFAPEGRRPVVAAHLDLFSVLHEKVAAERDLARLEPLVRKALGPAHARLGWAPDAFGAPAKGPKAPARKAPDEPADETALVRTAVLEALATLGRDEAVLREARRRADAFLAKQGPAQHPDNVAFALRAAARRGDAALWDALARALNEPGPPQDRIAVVGALASFEDPALLKRTLDLTLTEGVRFQDLRYVFPTFSRRETAPAAFAWAREHFDALARRLPPTMLGGLAGLLSSACTEAERDERRAFLGERLGHIEGSARPLALALDRSNACIYARSHEGPRLSAALDKAK